MLRDLVALGRRARRVVHARRDGGVGPRLRGTAARVNPQLVMLSTSLMGQTGPLSAFAGFGNLAGAITGFYELTGWPDRAPAGPFLAYTDYVAPKYTRGRPAGRARLATAHRLRPAPRPVAGRGVDPLPRPGDPRPHVNGVRPDAHGQRRRRSCTPTACSACAGDDEWVAIACEDDDQRDRARRGRRGARRTRPSRPGPPTASRRRGRAAPCRPSASPSTACRTAHACWTDPQLVHRGHYLTVDHPVHGHVRRRGPARRAVTDAGRRAPGRPDDGRAQRRRAARPPRLRRRPDHRRSSSPAPSADRSVRSSRCGRRRPGPCSRSSPSSPPCTDDTPGTERSVSPDASSTTSPVTQSVGDRVVDTPEAVGRTRRRPAGRCHRAGRRRVPVQAAPRRICVRHGRRADHAARLAPGGHPHQERVGRLRAVRSPATTGASRGSPVAHATKGIVLDGSVGTVIDGVEVLRHRRRGRALPVVLERRRAAQLVHPRHRPQQPAVRRGRRTSGRPRRTGTTTSAPMRSRGSPSATTPSGC